MKLPRRACAAWLASPPDADNAASISTEVASGQISSRSEEAMVVFSGDLH